MNERPDIEAVVIPPTASGVVLLTGAAELVADAILDLELAFDHFMREVAQDGAGITCVQLDLADESLEEVQAHIQSALVNLIEETPELTGWAPRVRLVRESHDDEVESLGMEDIDTQAERLLPSGDGIVDSLLRDIEHERSVHAASAQFQALPVEQLSTEDLNNLSDKERTAALHRASTLAGCLIQASVIVVDQLIDDITELRERKSTASLEIGDTWVLSDLPTRFAANYAALFAQEFLVALIDVTSRLTRGWEPLACVAQELGLRILLDRVEGVAVAADVALDDGWRSHLEDLLFEDLDHEFLYDPAYDGIEGDAASQPPGMAPMRFDDWFKPFNNERTLPPYALPTPPSTNVEI
jgi:hypothetical protein